MTIRESDAHDLRAALDTYDCRSHEDIRNVLGWEQWRLIAALRYTRRNAVALGWSIPHGRRGGGTRYVVVTPGVDALDATDLRSIRLGAISTLKAVITESTNQAEALKMAAAHLPGALATKLRSTARAQDGVAGSCEIVLADLETIPGP